MQRRFGKTKSDRLSKLLVALKEAQTEFTDRPTLSKKLNNLQRAILFWVQTDSLEVQDRGRLLPELHHELMIQLRIHNVPVLSSNLRVAMAGASGPDSSAPSTRVNQWQKSFTGLKVGAGLSSVAGAAVLNAGGAGAVQILGGV